MRTRSDLPKNDLFETHAVVAKRFRPPAQGRWSGGEGRISGDLDWPGQPVDDSDDSDQHETRWTKGAVSSILARSD
jgi:hypothetical protein